MTQNVILFCVTSRMSLAPRIDRLDLLARMLRNRPGITAAELARELGVSIRSVFRDIDHLRERGIPVESSRGRGGGLRVHARWGLANVLLSRDEALCTLLALAVSEKLGFPMFAPEVARSRRKIGDAFPDAERRRLGPLRERIFIGKTASAAVRASYAAPDVGPMRRLQAAFVDQRVVDAVYVKESGERSVRRLEPHALVINWPAWYLMAQDHSRGQPRTFRFDRFASVEIQSETFIPRPRDVARDLLQAGGVMLEPV
jgi:predicted DNA-binding transcriptional regulator YafY